jgi:hypothetical protein
MAVQMDPQWMEAVARQVAAMLSTRGPGPVDRIGVHSHPQSSLDVSKMVVSGHEEVKAEVTRDADAAEVEAKLRAKIEALVKEKDAMALVIKRLEAEVAATRENGKGITIIATQVGAAPKYMPKGNVRNVAPEKGVLCRHHDGGQTKTEEEINTMTCALGEALEEDVIRLKGLATLPGTPAIQGTNSSDPAVKVKAKAEKDTADALKERNDVLAKRAAALYETFSWYSSQGDSQQQSRAQEPLRVMQAAIRGWRCANVSKIER